MRVKIYEPPPNQIIFITYGDCTETKIKFKAWIICYKIRS